jgi:hypothetical protein
MDLNGKIGFVAIGGKGRLCPAERIGGAGLDKTVPPSLVRRRKEKKPHQKNELLHPQGLSLVLMAKLAVASRNASVARLASGLNCKGKRSLWVL